MYAVKSKNDVCNLARKILLPVSFLFLLAFSVRAQDSANVNIQRNPRVIHEIKHDVSPPLRDIPPAPLPSGVKRVMPNPMLPRPILDRPVGGQFDPVAQLWSGGPNIPSPMLNFDGNVAANSCPCAPPDTNGDVGPNHYIQITNVAYQVFNKSGNTLLGPIDINTLWSGFGGGCQNNNDGDPTVVYDGIADRWVIAQFSVSSTPFLECVAVSTTGDPLGTYNRYAFSYGNSFNDYPKMGVWPDAYYTTYNLFNSSGTVFLGADVCAMDRTKMLAGLTATQQCFQTSTSFGGLLPSDLDGPTLPPAGSPNYILGLGTTSTTLAFWKFHVDFGTPGNTTFVGPSNITVASYTEPCIGNRNCIAQSGTTTKLDAIGDRLMNRLAYRNFGDHESLVTNHSVLVGSSVAVRWYEIRTPGTTPSVFQQGTYAPDTNSRWMGSIAMDQSGDIALGFSVSSSSIHPQIHYTGRLPGDAAGTLPQGEGTIVDGPGSQTGGLNRWGDYSNMVVDPADDCTFWYTQEFIPSNGSFNWFTRVATFKFPSCGGGACSAPSGLTNNGAADVSSCADTGVQISWAKDAGNWGDGGNGTRTYDVLRNGVAISSGIAYGTTTFTDNNATNNTSFTYTVRYNNGCGQNATTSGVSATDVVPTGVSNLTNNSAADLNACADTGVQITWTKDAGSWGDNGVGTRTYDVLRNGTAIATGIAYGTTSTIDTTGTNGTSFNYTVRYNNGCGQIGTTTGASAADNVSAGTTQTADETMQLRVADGTKSSPLSPAFAFAGNAVDSANITWTAGATSDLTNCVAIRLRAPNNVTETTLKAVGQPNTGSADVLSFYQAQGPGTYSIVLQELANCGAPGTGAGIAPPPAHMTVHGCASCLPPTLQNNTAVDLDGCADTGVQITWPQDAMNWGDNNNGTRTYDVLRNGVVISSGITYGTTTFTDNTATNGSPFTYTVRYNNGCGQNATTPGAMATDFVTGTIKAADQTMQLRVADGTKTSPMSPAFTIPGNQTQAANISWTVGATSDLTNCVAVRLRAPDNVTELTLKAAGQVNPGSANITSFYQAQGAGAYTIVLQELANCGSAGTGAGLAPPPAHMTVQNSCP